MSTGQRAFWRFVPNEDREALIRNAAELLDTARSGEGDIVLNQQVRYTLAVRPDASQVPTIHPRDVPLG